MDDRFRDALDEAREQLATIDLDAIHAAGISRVKTDLLGSHTVVTYPPLDALVETDGHAILNELKFQPRVNAYVHIPFCEYPCNFCPYTTMMLGDSKAKPTSYLDVLGTEMRTWAHRLRSQDSRVHSLYIGGGTPFALPPDQLEDSLTRITLTLPFTKDPPICMETSPRATLTTDAKKKLALLRDIGVTRMSMGVQSFDFASLRHMARTFRGHTQSTEVAAAQALLDSGIPHINLDMIQDLPLPDGVDNWERLEADLATITRLAPHHITWYNMRLRPETSYAKRRDKLNLTTEEESLLTRLTIRNYLRASGYIAYEGDRFARSDCYQEDDFRKTRGSTTLDLLGMGVSAYSHVGDWFFANTRKTGTHIRTASGQAVQEYKERVLRDGHAISQAYPYTDGERCAALFALGLKRGVSLEEVNDLIMCSPEAAAYNNILKPNTRFVDAGLLEVVDGQVRFTPTGRLFENEVCEQFYTPVALANALHRRQDFDPDVHELANRYASAVSTNVLFASQKPLHLW